MYDLHDLSKKLGKNKNDTIKVVRKFRIGDNGSYSENDLHFLKNFFSANKKVLMDEVRDILRKEPFLTEAEICTRSARQLAYIRWILTELSFVDGELAETDDGKMFYVCRDTIEALEGRGIYLEDDDYYWALETYA